MNDQSSYLDSSAIVKLIVAEPESRALRIWLSERGRRASSAIARVEVLRAVRPSGDAAVERARLSLRRLDLVAVDESILESAARLEPENLRSLDAIHLATALSFGDDLESVVTYDRRMLEGAAALGLTTVSPGMS